ncbi:MAG: formate dehydrogenase subunit alpha [Alphaproteobacteria bacterium]|nr:formate dehydrogenase subunit alpha [Alphaproteobacteria bacterium]MBL6937957.1 formate dehydrogenase subunit alpha [Alphaproteobacteria bacterium]MBL7099218.1 formate dehydrogenase subunit alpha [Alphaproteobacteria bacterium]
MRIALNGFALDVEEGCTILEVAHRVGARIPTICFDQRLAPIGSCRICSVDVEGETHAQIACRTKVRAGMRITTASPRIDAFRRQVLRWLAAHVHPTSLEEEPDKELHRLLREYGVEPGLKRRRVPVDLSHPHIRVDMAQCISCFRCVRICEDLQGEFVWHALDRGDQLRIVPDSATTLRMSSCVGCGACADTCPSGALTDRGPRPVPTIERWTRTVCSYCGVGCEMKAGVSADKVVRVRPVLDAAVSKGHLCVKGRYAHGFTHASDRLTRPLLKAQGRWTPVSWDESLSHSASEFKRILDIYGPESIGVLGSARATNEENYLAQKFARVVLGTNNVDCCARVCHTPSAAALKAMLGTGAATNSFSDIEHAQTIFVFGANPLENHPIVGARIRHQAMKQGVNLIVADPRRTDLARVAKLHLQLRPGTNIPLLNAIANVIVTERLEDRAFTSERVTGLEEFRAFIAQWSPERAAEICDVPPTDIRMAARLYAGAKPSMSFHGLGLTEHTQGTEGVMTLINLALLTGNLGKPGTGINPLRGQNNVQGAAQMGCDPSILTGSVALEEGRRLFEQTWGVPVPHRRGLNLLQMLDEALAGRLKALWIIGYDILATLPNMNVTRTALKNLEFIVVQDLFMTETARAAANVVLPAASTFEKDGTFMNAERRVQRVRKAVSPPGEAKTDWEIICALAARMGHEAKFRYSSAQDIWDEVRAVWPDVGGISYRRIEDGGLQWPCRSETDPGLEILHSTAFARATTASLARIAYVPSPESVSPEYPLLLTTGRTLYQFNAGTMTARTPTNRLRPTDVLDMSPNDANALGIATGDRVRVRSRYGLARMRAKVVEAMRPGEVFATFHNPRVALNKLTGPARDTMVQSPEYKVTAVRVEKAVSSRI